MELVISNYYHTPLVRMCVVNSKYSNFIEEIYILYTVAVFDPLHFKETSNLVTFTVISRCECLCQVDLISLSVVSL